MPPWLAFSLITVAPIATGALLGGRLGATALLRALTVYATGAFAFTATTTLAYAGHWFWPLGLITPLAAGAVAGLTASWICVRVRPRSTPANHAGRAGAALGGAVGAAVALLAWLALPLLDAGRAARRTPAPSSNERTATGAPADLTASLGELAMIAHRGLLRHVPLLGETSDEVTAVCTLLRATPAQRRRLADELDIADLAELPSVRAALADSALRDDLQRAGDGDALAIFRLQRHPLVLAVAEDARVAALFDQLLPSRMAGMLEPDREAGSPPHRDARADSRTQATRSR